MELTKALRNAGVDVDTTRAFKLQDWTLVNGQPQEQRVATVAPALEYKKLSRASPRHRWHWLGTWSRKAVSTPSTWWGRRHRPVGGARWGA
ncbi:hypothetical protein QJS66_18655 [Kocuria rhizophila]|nr:hypothetical protein QJS66_18655 [Kocuria rhizophila]